MPIKYVIFSSSDEMNEYATKLAGKGCQVLLARIEDETEWGMFEDEMVEEAIDRNMSEFFDAKKSSLMRLSAEDVLGRLEEITDDKESYLILCDENFSGISYEITELWNSGFTIFTIPKGWTRRTPQRVERPLDVEDDEMSEGMNDLNGFKESGF